MEARILRWNLDVVGAVPGWGGVVYRALAELSGRHGWGGRVPVLAADPAVLAQHLGFPAAEVPAVLGALARGLQEVELAGAVRRLGEVLELRAWAEFDAGAGNRDRQRAFRQRRRQAKAARAAAPPRRWGGADAPGGLPLGLTSGPERNVTPPPAPPSGGRNVTPPSPPSSPPPGPPPLSPPPFPPCAPPRNVTAVTLLPVEASPATAEAAATAPWREGQETAPVAACGVLEPSDPRQDHGEAVRRLEAVLRSRAAVLAADPESAWFGDVQVELVRLGRPEGLTARPALAAFRDQANALRRAGVSAAAVAGVLARAPVAALPSEVFRQLRRGAGGTGPSGGGR